MRVWRPVVIDGRSLGRPMSCFAFGMVWLHWAAFLCAFAGLSTLCVRRFECCLYIAWIGIPGIGIITDGYYAVVV